MTSYNYFLPPLAESGFLFSFFLSGFRFIEWKSALLIEPSFRSGAHDLSLLTSCGCVSVCVSVWGCGQSTGLCWWRQRPCSCSTNRSADHRNECLWMEWLGSSPPPRVIRLVLQDASHPVMAWETAYVSPQKKISLSLRISGRIAKKRTTKWQILHIASYFHALLPAEKWVSPSFGTQPDISLPL